MANKYSRPFTPAWRWFIAAGSVSAFVGGWAVLAHTPNPYGNTAAAASSAPVIETSVPFSNPTQAPLQTAPRTNRQPQTAPRATPQKAQPLPSQGSGTTPNVAPRQLPNTQPRSSRSQRQPRMRTGGS